MFSHGLSIARRTVSSSRFSNVAGHSTLKSDASRKALAHSRSSNIQPMKVELRVGGSNVPPIACHSTTYASGSVGNAVSANVLIVQACATKKRPDVRDVYAHRNEAGLPRPLNVGAALKVAQRVYKPRHPRAFVDERERATAFNNRMGSAYARKSPTTPIDLNSRIAARSNSRM